MNIDHANKRPAEIQPQRDYFADALMIGLSRQIYFKLARGPLRTLLTSLISFGVAPILMWQWQFKRYVIYEQQQFWHLAKWLQGNLKQTKSEKKVDALLSALEDCARERPPQFEFRLLSHLCMAFLAIIFFTQLFDFGRHGLSAVLDCTYLYPAGLAGLIKSLVARPLATKLYFIWNVCISGAAMCHIGEVYHHQRRVREFVDHFRALANELNPNAPKANLFNPTIRLSRQWVWIISGILLLLSGVFWALPVMLAGAAHCRLMRVVSLVHRSEIALQFRDIRRQLNPEQVIKLPVHLRNWCSNELCGAPLPEGDSICTLCQSESLEPLYVRVNRQ